MSKTHHRCYVLNCKGGKKGSEQGDHVGFFKIPSVIRKQDLKTEELSSKRRSLWLKKLRLSAFKDIEKVKICSRHFYSGKPSKLYDTTHPDWVPNLNLGYEHNQSMSHSNSVGDGQAKLRRHARRIKRFQGVTPVSSKPKESLFNPTAVSTPIARVLRLEDPLIDVSTISKSSCLTPSEEATSSSFSKEVDIPLFTDEAEVSFLWEDAPTTLDSLLISDEGIASLTSTKYQEGENLKVSNATQTFSSSIDKSTQINPKYVEISTQTELMDLDVIVNEVEREMVDCSTQAGQISVEGCSQTVIRVCERFELDYAEIKNKEACQEISDLTVKLEETRSLLTTCRENIKQLVSELGTLEEELGQHKYTEFYFRGDRGNLKVKYFTGLESLDVLLVLVKEVSPYLFQCSKLSIFQQVVLTIMKLRLALTNKDLSFRFWVSEATVGRIFYNCLNVLYNRLQKFVRWPERDELCGTMPMCFREKFGKQCAVIIDCFEVFTHKPSSVKCRAETYSNYKSCNTVKFLIGVTPQGSISFISKGWGGRVSDKHRTENSGLLKNLLPGDLVLADRGFNIDDSVGFYYATIKYPTFTKGKSQLSPQDVESTRKLANVRIHVERVIGHLRQKYTILFTKLPIDLLNVAPDEEMATLDKIAVVCAALTNLTPSVVPFD